MADRRPIGTQNETDILRVELPDGTRYVQFDDIRLFDHGQVAKMPLPCQHGEVSAMSGSVQPCVRRLVNIRRHVRLDVILIVSPSASAFPSLSLICVVFLVSPYLPLRSDRP